MPTSLGSLKPLVSVNTSAQLYNSVGYPVGGNISTMTSATFVANWTLGTVLINVTYIIGGTIVPGMSISGQGIPAGATIVGPLNNYGTGTGYTGTYTISLATILPSGNSIPSPFPAPSAGTVLSGTASPASYPQGPNGIVGPVPGFNCVNITDIRNYYNVPYPPATPLSSPPVIAVVSFGGGIYGQPITTGSNAGFWSCSDIAGPKGSPIQILVVPINGAINAPNSDDGGATLENTVDVATVNAFYGMNDPRVNAPIYTPPIILLFIAPSSDISEMYRTFYTVLNNPVICNGRSYSPTIVTCSWGAPEIAWTQKMPFPPDPSIPVDNSPNPEGIAELNEINDLLANASKNGINICCASGDIPLNTINTSVNTYNYAQALLLQGTGGNGYPTGLVAQSQPSVFPLTDVARLSLPAPQVFFPASSPYVTCVGGSAVYFPDINSGAYTNPAEFAWTRGNGGISSVFSIPTYQQELPGSASVSAAQFLANSITTSNLASTALGIPAPILDPISGAYTAPNTASTLANEVNNAIYVNAKATFANASAALEAAQTGTVTDSSDILINNLIKSVKDASTALATATSNKELSNTAFDNAGEFVVTTQSVSSLLDNVATVFGAAEASLASANSTQQALLTATFNAQRAAYTQLVSPSTTNMNALQAANQTVQTAQAAAQAAALSAVTLPVAITSVTDIANKAVAQAAAAVFAPSLSTHPYLEAVPYTSPLVPKSNLAYDTAHTISAILPYDPNATSAPQYLITSLGTGYNNINSVNTSGYSIGTIRSNLQNAVNAAANLVRELVNFVPYRDTSGTLINYLGNSSNNIGSVAKLSDAEIVSSNGQLSTTGPYNTLVNNWISRASVNEILPLIAIGSAGAWSGLQAVSFATRAKAVGLSGAAFISSYASGAGSSIMPGWNLPCGLASAAISALAAIYQVTNSERSEDAKAGYPFGILDTTGGSDASGNYTGITPALVNLRNIYANITLTARRMKTANKAAHDATDAFIAWNNAYNLVNTLQTQATTLYNTVPTPSYESIRAMNAQLNNANANLSSASYSLAIANNYAVTTARLLQQSAASTSVWMGNRIATTFDQLGNLKSVDITDSSGYQGSNNANCPLIKIIFDSSGNVQGREALTAAQSLIQAAANETYLGTTITTVYKHTITGVDSSGIQTLNITGSRLLVQDAQFAAAAAASQVANVAFFDSTEAMTRYTDWRNLSLVANAANFASSRVALAFVDSSGSIFDSSGNSKLINAVTAANNTVTLLTATITPYNQQNTPSATIATNNVVSLAAKLETLRNVCLAAQTAIQLAASTFNNSVTGTNISGQGNGQGGTIFTVNMAYAKVTANAAQAASTAAAILAREELVLAARRANYSAIALQKLVGEGVCGQAIAGFLDPSGNLVTQTGFGPDSSGTQFSLPYTLGGSNNVNGYKPPSVTAKTVLYQGSGGLDFNATLNSLGNLESISNPQPSLITNLSYTSSQYTNVYQAVAAFAKNAQLVLNTLEADSSGNTLQLSSFNKFLTNPNVNGVNALDSSGNALSFIQNSLLSSYEAQQWVVASANASFVNFGFQSANTILISFTPTISGIFNKLVVDADDCLNTVLTAEGAILHALSIRPRRVIPHDIDAYNFAAAFNSNQSAADTYLELENSAIRHQANTLLSFHLADLANALSPLAANSTMSAMQSAALGGASYTDPPPISDYYAALSLKSVNFPAGSWESAGIRGANLSNPNPGPFNGTATGLAPFPAPNASQSSRIQAPAATTLQISSQLINGYLSSYALATAFSASNTAQSSTSFNNLMVRRSTITPALVDAVRSASDLTLSAANYANYATSLINQGLVTTPYVSVTALLVIESFQQVLEAQSSALANLQTTSTSDIRYIPRQNMVYLWNLAVDAVKELVQATANSPTNYDLVFRPDGSGNRVDASGNFMAIANTYDGSGNRLPPSDPANIDPASLGDPTIMGKTNSFNTVGSNNAPIWTPGGLYDTRIVYGPNNTVTSSLSPSLLSLVNQAVRNAYNATTGAPNSRQAYTYVQFYWPVGQTSTIVTNVPENVNDTLQAYNNSVEALNAVMSIGNALISAVQSAALKILAAYQAAVAVLAAPPALPVDSSNNSLLPSNAGTSGSGSLVAGSLPPGYNASQAAAAYAVVYWNSALVKVNTMLIKDGSGNYPNLSGTTALNNLFELQGIVGLNFTNIIPSDTSSLSVSIANLANTRQDQMMGQWANATPASWTGYTPTGGVSLSTTSGALAAGYGAYTGLNYLGSYGLASGTFNNGTSVFAAPLNWSAFYWTKAISYTGTVAYKTAYDAWQAVQTALSYYTNQYTVLDTNAQNANLAKAASVYAIKIALQSAARVSYTANESLNASSALAVSNDSYENLAALNATKVAYNSTAKLNMFRCVPDIAMHANADDLPVIYTLNGGSVYVGGTSVASAMFAGFLAVVQSHNPINFFVNPILYDNYTYPSPLFNDISGSKQVWYSGSVGGPTVPPRIANILPGLQNPLSGLGSGLYNCNVGLGSINAMNMAAIMQVPHLVTGIYPNLTNSASVTVYPGTSATVTAYVEPVTAYNANVQWTCSTFNATITQTNGPILSNNGNNDTQPYTTYDPLQHDSSGNPLPISSSVGSYALGTLGNVALGVNPWHKDGIYPNGYPCLIFTATVTGVTPVPSSQSLPVITISSSDGSDVYGNISVIVLPPIQVTGISISSLNQITNPSNTVLFLGNTLQLVGNVTPINATHKQIYWWSSNTTVVNVDVNGLLTALAPGNVTIKATTLNNNISASISVYVPTPITGLNILPTSVTLNTNMNIFPLKNTVTLNAIIQPANADYKYLKWEIISSIQTQPAPTGISSVISIPSNGNILARNGTGAIIDNSQATVTAISNGSAVLKVSTYGDEYGLYGIYNATVNINVVTPITEVVMTQRNMIVNLNPTTTTNPVLPESYNVTVTLKPAYPSNMNVFWTSSNPKVAVVSNNTPPVLNTVTSDPNFGLWQITETITPLSNGTTVITVISADGEKSDSTTVVITTPVSGLSMSALPIILNPTRSYALQANVIPSTATNKLLRWETTNTSIATVTQNGVITAVTSGSCAISARTLDGDFSAMANVTVVTPLVGIQLVVTTPQPIHVGNTVQILVVMVPTTATNQLFSWTITNGPNGAIFTTGPPQNGNIVYLDAFNSGTSVFTVTTADGNKQASINLTVLAY